MFAVSMFRISKEKLTFLRHLYFRLDLILLLKLRIVLDISKFSITVYVQNVYSLEFVFENFLCREFFATGSVIAGKTARQEPANPGQEVKKYAGFL